MQIQWRHLTLPGTVRLSWINCRKKLRKRMVHLLREDESDFEKHTYKNACFFVPKPEKSWLFLGAKYGCSLNLLNTYTIPFLMNENFHSSRGRCWWMKIFIHHWWMKFSFIEIHHIHRIVMLSETFHISITACTLARILNIGLGIEAWTTEYSNY